jgi:hypothetical protein
MDICDMLSDWNNKSLGEKMAEIEQYINDIFNEYGRYVQPTVSFEEIQGGKCGAYNPGTLTIKISPDCLEREDSDEMVKTAFEEAFHSIQDQFLAENYGVDLADKIEEYRQEIEEMASDAADLTWTEIEEECESLDYAESGGEEDLPTDGPEGEWQID